MSSDLYLTKQHFCRSAHWYEAICPLSSNIRFNAYTHSSGSTNSGWSGTTEENYDKVVQILNLPDKVLEISHGSTSQSGVEYRLAWSHTYLKKYGLLQNSARGVWSLVSTSLNLDNLDAKEIVKAVRDTEKSKVASSDPTTVAAESIETLEELAWHQQLHKMLLTLELAVFEH